MSKEDKKVAKIEEVKQVKQQLKTEPLSEQQMFGKFIDNL